MSVQVRKLVLVQARQATHPGVRGATLQDSRPPLIQTGRLKGCESQLEAGPPPRAMINDLIQKEDKGMDAKIREKVWEAAVRMAATQRKVVKATKEANKKRKNAAKEKET